ncbi:hypothetical protein [Arthrobacter sp. K5]|uniref:Uncharacterized protein n=1 Tax=Arthrobacter sp. K5 TaxID=2839623 RepID=A0AAU8EYI7_9MICC
MTTLFLAGLSLLTQSPGWAGRSWRSRIVKGAGAGLRSGNWPDGDAFLDSDTVAAKKPATGVGIGVLNFPTAFGVVFMKPHPGCDFGSYQAFGHDGAGGALGYADPLYGISFGYIPLQMQLPGGADVRAIHLSQTVRAAVRQS